MGRAVKLSAAVQKPHVEDRLRMVVSAANAKRGAMNYPEHVESLKRLAADPLLPAWWRERLGLRLKVYAQLDELVAYIGPEHFERDPKPFISMVAAMPP